MISQSLTKGSRSLGNSKGTLMGTTLASSNRKERSAPSIFSLFLISKPFVNPRASSLLTLNGNSKVLEVGLSMSARQGESCNKLTLELKMGSFEYLKCLTGEPEFMDLERRLEVWILELQTSKRSGLFAEIECFELCRREGAEAKTEGEGSLNYASKLISLVAETRN